MFASASSSSAPLPTFATSVGAAAAAARRPPLPPHHGLPAPGVLPPLGGGHLPTDLVPTPYHHPSFPSFPLPQVHAPTSPPPYSHPHPHQHDHQHSTGAPPPHQQHDGLPFMETQQQQQRPERLEEGGHPEEGKGITFNFNRRRVSAARGGDVEVRVSLSFEESVRGCIKELRLRALVPCAVCEGRGVRSLIEAGLVRGREDLSECVHCHGTGTFSRRSALLTINSTCGHCNGHGYLVDHPCSVCSQGRVSDEKVLQIEIPPGVMHDMRMIYAGQGDVGEFGGEAGNLIVVFAVQESHLFQRNGDDVLSEVNISFFEAALGATVLIAGIYGNEIPLEIPPGTQAGDTICLKGEGFVRMRSAPVSQPGAMPSCQPSGTESESSAEKSSSEQHPPPHYQYRRRRRRRQSYQPPEGDADRPAIRTVNRSEYFNSLLQKSNFFSSTFLQQGNNSGDGANTSSPFSLFNQVHCSPRSSASSAPASTNSESSGLQFEATAGSAANDSGSVQWREMSEQHVSEAGSEEDQHTERGSSSPKSSYCHTAGRESSVGFEDENNGPRPKHFSTHADKHSSGSGDSMAVEYGYEEESETASYGSDGNRGMAKEAEAEEPLFVNGYSPAVEAERRVCPSSSNSEEDGLEVRHVVICTETFSHTPFDTANKAKEEEREESGALDAIDGEILPMNDDACAVVKLLPRDAAASLMTVTTYSSATADASQQRGDMYVKIKVAVPQFLNSQQNQLLASLQHQILHTTTADA